MNSDNEHKPAGPPPDSVDLWLKRRIEPPPEAVERITRESLCASQKRRFVSGWWALAAASFGIVLVAAALMLMTLDDPSTTDVAGAHAPSVPTITNASGSLELLMPAAEGDPRSDPVGTSEPESTTPVIFNEARVVAAIVPDGDPTFLITGGEL
jgi:hypothetical protein